MIKFPNEWRAIAIIFVLIMLVAVGSIAWMIYYHTTATTTKPPVTQQQDATNVAAAKTAEVALKAAVEKAKAEEEKMALEQVDLVVHKGEGVESPLIRQLTADPSLADHYKGRFTGNRDDKAAVKKWAGHEVAVLAEGGGIVGWKFSEEYRVKVPNTLAFAFVKDPKGGLKLVQYAASALAAEAAATKATDTAAKFAPPTPVAPNEIVLAGTSFSQTAAFNVAPTFSASRVPFTTKPSGDIVFSSPFAYIYDGVPPQNG